MVRCKIRRVEIANSCNELLSIASCADILKELSVRWSGLDGGGARWTVYETLERWRWFELVCQVLLRLVLRKMKTYAVD